MAVQPGLCRTWLETPKTGFLRKRLICQLQKELLIVLVICPQKLCQAILQLAPGKYHMAKSGLKIKNVEGLCNKIKHKKMKTTLICLYLLGILFANDANMHVAMTYIKLLYNS